MSCAFRKTFLFICILLGPVTSALASKESECPTNELKAAAKKISSRRVVRITEKFATDLFSRPLPPETVQAILASPSTQALRKKYGQGKNLIFKDALFDPTEGTKGHNRGEWIQAQFVKKTLEVIFPQAEIADSVFSVREIYKREKKIIPININDPAEFGMDPGKSETFLSLEMPKLKAASSGSLRFPREQARDYFRLSPDQKVASFYIGSVLSRPDVDQVAEEFFKKGYHTVILSDVGDPPGSMTAIYRNILKDAGVRILYLSKMSSRDLPLRPDLNTIIINDVQGAMPILHASSDLVYVQGPINPFEGLAQKVKTLILNNPQTLREYDASTYQQMTQTALGTGQAKAIEKLSQIADGISDLESRDSSSFTSPEQVVTDGHSALEDFLMHLQERMPESPYDDF